jgi:hypothetical protein
MLKSIIPVYLIILKKTELDLIVDMIHLILGLFEIQSEIALFKISKKHFLG